VVCVRVLVRVYLSAESHRSRQGTTAKLQKMTGRGNNRRQIRPAMIWNRTDEDEKTVFSEYLATASSERKTTKDGEKTEKHPKVLDFVTFADRHGHAAGAARF